MRRLRALILRIVGAFDRERWNRELAEEIESHFQMHVDDNLLAGMSLDQARNAALLKFGGIDKTIEECRDQRGFRWLEEIRQDLRYGIRQLRENRGSTIAALAILALTIGINTAVFSIANFVLFRPLPVHAPHELLSIYSVHEKGSRPHFVSFPDFVDLRNQNQVFADMACWTLSRISLSAGNQTEVAYGQIVSGNYFEVLGVKPELGRLFSQEESRINEMHAVVIISHWLWERLFQSHPRILGKSLRLNGHDFTIVAVAPPEFRGLWYSGMSAQFWIPVSMIAQIGKRQALVDRQMESFLVIGRLKAGKSLKEAEAVIEAKGRQLTHAYPATNGNRSFTILPTESIRIFPDPTSDSTPKLISMAFFSVTVLVLLIAGANLTGILVAKGITRRKEIAVRLALGADKWRIVRQLLTETLILSMAGGVLGLGVAWLLVNLAVANFPSRLAFIELSLDIPIDTTVLIFTLLICIATGIFIGVAPALQCSRLDLVSALSTEGTGTLQKNNSRVRHWIVAPQVCVSVFLLLLAGLFIRTVLKAEMTTRGFDRGHTAIVDIDLNWSNYGEDKGRTFYRSLLLNAGSLPGITYVSLTDKLPTTTGTSARFSATTDGDQPPDRPNNSVDCARISPDYFKVMTVPIINGRSFTVSDNLTSPRVVILDEHAARTFWPRRDPIGKLMTLAGDKGELIRARVVGISKEVHQSFVSQSQPRLPLIYIPFEQNYYPRMKLVASSSEKPSLLVDRLKHLVFEVDRNAPIVESVTMDEEVGRNLLPLRLTAILLFISGLFGLFLAAVGLYGVVSYTVGRRTREIGIRMALGAQNKDIMHMVMHDVLYISLCGSMSGLLMALIASQLISLLTEGLVPFDPITPLALHVVLYAVVLTACYIPARRALYLEPLTALREM